ncbi:DUF6318 family protein [Tenggerimyces flavus]|uniref:DUF6318 family protein n=1 Tax=Tenggerimyces flavus TaxID=1708749 RepID=A0ABV7YDI3_9ACTN|nr:DUF6318 family protein [Tenggerimyces flavus]MBM7787190.1 hypothetical protein [Tenggerimyces flavus]
MTAAVLVLATACTGTPEPPVVETGDTPAASKSPTAAPTSSAEPADEFARQYIRATNTALTKGDVKQLRDLSVPSCESCARNADAMETFHSNGGSYQGDPSWHITEVSKPTGTDPATVSMYVQVKPHQVVAKKGAAPKPSQERVFLIDLTLGKEDGRWKVRDLVINSG